MTLLFLLTLTAFGADTFAPLSGSSPIYLRDYKQFDWPVLVVCHTDGSGHIACDNSITAATLPLPAGASTAAKQDTQSQWLSSHDSHLSAIDISTATYSAAGATSAKQDTGNASLAAMNSKLANPMPVVSTPLTSSTVVKTTSASIALVSLQIVGANPNRKAFYLWNNGANTAYCDFGSIVSSASPGFIVATFTSFSPTNGVSWQGPISCIRNAGAGTMTISEIQ